MLLIKFTAGNEAYLIDTRSVIEVTTLVRLKKFPGKTDGIAGLLNYHGTAVPVIDINHLFDTPSAQNTLTTRIMVVNYLDDNIIGIKADNITDTIQIDKKEFKNPGLELNNKQFLGDVVEIDKRFVQLVDINKLMTEKAYAALFFEANKAVG